MEETYTVLVDPVMMGADEMKEMLQDAIFDYSIEVANANGVGLGTTQFDEYYKEVQKTAQEVFDFTHYFQYISLVAVKTMLETGMASLTVKSTTTDTVEEDLTQAIRILATVLSGALVHVVISKNDTWANNEVLEETNKDIRSVPFDFHATLLAKENDD